MITISMGWLTGTTRVELLGEKFGFTFLNCDIISYSELSSGEDGLPKGQNDMLAFEQQTVYHVWVVKKDSKEYGGLRNQVCKRIAVSQ